MSEADKPGYRRPPREHQFKPGKSGNPNGRPKRPKNNSEVLSALNLERIRMTINGKPKWVSPFEAAARRTLQICMAKGNPRDLKILFEMLKEEGFDWREEMRAESEQAAESVRKKILQIFDRVIPDDDDDVQSAITASEDLECGTVLNCPACGPRIRGIQGEHRVDPKTREHPTRFGRQVRDYSSRRAKAPSTK